jgi:hypothetical protein
VIGLVYSRKRDDALGALRSDGRRSLYFKVQEFACRDGSDEVHIDTALVDILDGLRERFGPININSGYRTPAYNAKIGGAKASQHMLGTAADTGYERGVKLEDAAKYAQWLGAGGIGVYSVGDGNFVHVDTRTKPSYWRGHQQSRVSTWMTEADKVRFDKEAKNVKEKIPVIIDGKTVYGYLIDGTTYMPVKEGMLAYDTAAKITWDEKARKVTVFNG